MSIKAKLVKIFQEVGKIDFSKMKLNNIDMFASDEITSKIRPIFEINNVAPMTSTRWDHERKVVSVHICYINSDDDTEFNQTIEHPINDQLWGGGNLSLANKWGYLLWLMIGTKDDLNLKGKDNKEVLGNVIKAEDTGKAIYDIPPGTMGAPIIADGKGVGEGGTIPTDHISTLINTVVQETGLPEEVVKPEKKEPTPNQSLMDKINEGGWEVQVKLEDCMSEATVIKALDSYYGSKATALYGHSDNDLCPINPYQAIDKFPRRSNLKIRRAIIQFRVFGEEAFWRALEVDTGATREDIKKLLIALPKQEEQPPQKIIHNLKLNFEIPEHLGNDRSEEVCTQLLANIRAFGVPPFSILYALNQMKDKPEIDMASGDSGIITQFLAKASKLQIEEMIKTAQAAG